MKLGLESLEVKPSQEGFFNNLWMRLKYAFTSEASVQNQIRVKINALKNADPYSVENQEIDFGLCQPNAIIEFFNFIPQLLKGINMVIPGIADASEELDNADFDKIDKDIATLGKANQIKMQRLDNWMYYGVPKGTTFGSQGYTQAVMVKLVETYIKNYQVVNVQINSIWSTLEKIGSTIEYVSVTDTENSSTSETRNKTADDWSDDPDSTTTTSGSSTTVTYTTPVSRLKKEYFDIIDILYRVCSIYEQLTYFAYRLVNLV